MIYCFMKILVMIQMMEIIVISLVLTKLAISLGLQMSKGLQIDGKYQAENGKVKMYMPNLLSPQILSV